MLQRSKVVFDADSHSYTIKDKTLKGITGIIHEYVLPELYKGVPQAVLNKAAAYGSMVHSDIEFYNSLGGVPETPEGKSYAELNLKAIASEYTVSDNKHFASQIDLVLEGNDLADIKTTSAYNEEYVRWQLSIYAYLFDMQNKKTGEKARRLYCIWIPKGGKAKMIEVARIEDSVIKSLLNAAAKGKEWTNPLRAADNALISTEQSKALWLISTRIKTLEETLKAAKEEKDRIFSSLTQLMQENGVKKIDNDYFSLTYIAPGERFTIDTSKLKEERPDIADCYSKLTPVAATVRIKLKATTI